MKTYRCTRKSDAKVFFCQAADHTELLERYDISEEYFDIEEGISLGSIE